MNFERSLKEIIFKLHTSPTECMFYGLFLAELNKVFDDDLPTACVGKHISSSQITLMLGKRWWEQTCYNDGRKIWTLIHELEHVVREHLLEAASGMYPDKHLANIAMDMSINQTIPKFLKIDANGKGEYPIEMPDPDENGKSNLVIFENFKHLKMEPLKGSMYYYNRLKEAQRNKKESKKKGQDSMAPGQSKGNKRGTSGDPEADKWLDSIEDGTISDWHKQWGDLTSEMSAPEQEVFRREMQEILRRTVKEVEKNRGNVPTHVKDAIAENFGIEPPVTSWKTLFRRFIGSSLDSQVKQSRKRPNFRFEDAPVWKHTTKVKIIVGTDTSGSVSDDDLQHFFSEIRHMYKGGASVDICLWDQECEPAYEYKGEQNYRRTKCGGTRASCFIEYVNEHKSKKRYTCAIALTDGYIEKNPIDCNIPMLWVITADGTTEFEHIGKKIKMQ